MSIYLDTSFLISLYCFDTNSAAAAQALYLVSDSVEVIVSTFAELEVVNGLELRHFRKQMSAAETRLTQEAFVDDLLSGRFRVRALPERVFPRGNELSRKTTADFGTRTSDLLHVAAALEFGVREFYSFDRQQRKLAESVKLRVNPY